MERGPSRKFEIGPNKVDFRIGPKNCKNIKLVQKQSSFQNWAKKCKYIKLGQKIIVGYRIGPKDAKIQN